MILKKTFFLFLAFWNKCSRTKIVKIKIRRRQNKMCLSTPYYVHFLNLSGLCVINY